MDRIDDSTLVIIDRAFRGARTFATWPRGDSPRDAVEALIGWWSDGGLDVRCLWWAIDCFGAHAVEHAASMLSPGPVEHEGKMRDFVFSWLRGVADKAWISEQPIVRTGLRSFKVDANGTRIWDFGQIE